MFQLSLFYNDLEQRFYEAIIADLKRGSGFVNGKIRIKAMFENKNISKEERIKLLKKEYGIGGHSGPNEPTVWYDKSGIGIELKTGEKKKYNWETIHDLLHMLISQGQY